MQDNDAYVELKDVRINRETEGVSGAYLIAVEVLFEVDGVETQHKAWDNVWFPKQTCVVEAENVFVLRTFLECKEREIAETNNYKLCGIVTVETEEDEATDE